MDDDNVGDLKVCIYRLAALYLLIFFFILFYFLSFLLLRCSEGTIHVWGVNINFFFFLFYSCTSFGAPITLFCIIHCSNTCVVMNINF